MLSARFQMVLPTTSEGSRSGVNWMRPNSACTVMASALARLVLPHAGGVFDEQVALGQ